MPTDRIKQLQKFYEEDPLDPFNLYALALEHLNFDPGKTQSLFEILLNDHKDYVPTYYHAAKLCQERGQREKAIRIFELGISVAEKQKDNKALRELKSAYDELMFE
jgi:tetratricopeptide (TPR) repeat protein